MENMWQHPTLRKIGFNITFLEEKKILIFI